MQNTSLFFSAAFMIGSVYEKLLMTTKIFTATDAV